MRFESRTLECSHLGYAALESIFHNEISNDLKVPHINLKQFISAKTSKLLTYLVKEKHDKSKAGIIVIILWWEWDFWEAGGFFDQSTEFLTVQNEITNAFKRNRCQLNAQLSCGTGVIWSNMNCLCGISRQVMSMSYLEKVLTESDLQNWALLTRKYKVYVYSYIFINQSLHETLSHSTFCREGPRDIISL